MKPIRFLQCDGTLIHRDPAHVVFDLLVEYGDRAMPEALAMIAECTDERVRNILNECVARLQNLSTEVFERRRWRRVWSHT